MVFKKWAIAFQSSSNNDEVATSFYKPRQQLNIIVHARCGREGLRLACPPPHLFDDNAIVAIAVAIPHTGHQNLFMDFQ
jgi:hypothetical protein